MLLSHFADASAVSMLATLNGQTASVALELAAAYVAMLISLLARFLLKKRIRTTGSLWIVVKL